LFVAESQDVLSNDLKTLILNLHNDARKAVQPPATGMNDLLWDENLAFAAQNYINTCPEDHDPNLGTVQHGENLGKLEILHSSCTYVLDVCP
jgi:hypothetical protein